MLNFFFFFIKYLCVCTHVSVFAGDHAYVNGYQNFLYLLLSEGLVEFFIVYIVISNHSFLVTNQLG
jgi:hypothetical protein